MQTIPITTFVYKMNKVGFSAFEGAIRRARDDDRSEYVELGHWLFEALSDQDSDLSATLRGMGHDRGTVLKDIADALRRLPKREGGKPGISSVMRDAFEAGWVQATLTFGEVQLRSGHILVAALSDPRLRNELEGYSPVFARLDPEQIAAEAQSLWKETIENTTRPQDAGDPGAPRAAQGSGALDRFAVDMTAQAQAGKFDRIVGRDDEIRQVIDVLLRRRQNNPILTGEAGVGKTAVVEGFAQRLAEGTVPPKLHGTKLYMLDIQAMQAGASMKGEFEQRLKSVIDDVQASATPIILFIDEAHTLIGAGGAAGTGDAANLLKPALARGTLRTIAATTWSEYRQYFEKDPALTRRFQPVTVDEPSVDRCCYMLRGVMGPMEAHHNVRISDEAIVAAVSLSHRYIPARQLPDKAVSLLDTACARVAVSQAALPARIEDTREAIAALDAEIMAKQAERDLGETNEDRIAEAQAEKSELEVKLADLEASHAREKALVDQVIALRKAIAVAEGRAPEAVADARPAEQEEAADALAEAQGDSTDPEKARAEMRAVMADLEAGNPDDRMVYAHVDAQAVASVISDWTGIPAGRMVQDELQAVLNLSDHLRERVIGQDHGLKAIAKRIETNRAGLSNPEKPIGVFMLCGPSGVGKTETALALAEQLYGGQDNVITINMSEYQEAHTVSLLKGAPPGYVGFGEGGRLTEAVRRKPYSVVLLDEVEKAHPDVHELFFQVFDKGVMEDGNGRRIDFRNTLILLTSNVGTDVIMDMAESGEKEVGVDALEAALKPEQLRVFPPALLGRIVSIPYFPLSKEVLGGIARLKLGSVARRLKTAHDAALVYDDAVIDHIVSLCRDPDSGGRMIDNVITNSILPEMSRQVLGRMVSGEALREVKVSVTDGVFGYEFG
ncbi:type VI secretion system ATPase TssH [Thetidibacter halocola]|uniref:Type VI secretion system ATPase TssH n=1 Tax=Thetidibacter halocola TaxID=2827239 RepID=A0A8J8B8V9_9RHOB|nr:type VI secretion system ATPase TssH [Thetidibacter halocola]MBS0123558.1 type VI secretion system ATPase TssH [Thetidibacter halocola]